MAQYYNIADEKTKATMRVDVWEKPVEQTNGKEIDAKLAEYGPMGHYVYERGMLRIFKFAEMSEADLVDIQTLLQQAKLNQMATEVSSIKKWVLFWSIATIACMVIYFAISMEHYF